VNPLKVIYSLPFRARVRSWFVREDGGVPQAYRYVGGVTSDRWWTRSILKASAVRPGAKVLDIGCGVGEDCALVMEVVGPSGKYCGFDIVRRGIDYCRKTYPDAEFKWCDVRNDLYNPSGTIKPEQFVFPYPDETFDHVIATSVFTHLLPGAVERYLAEAFRVTKRGGSAALTFFVLDYRSLPSVLKGVSSWTFPHDFGTHRTHRKVMGREGAVAYHVGLLEKAVKAAGWEGEKFLPGSWYCKGDRKALSNGEHYQDVLIVRKQ
jgi:ubiquinone/menaquinone biosynthesis C-methylase UbiE